MRILVPIAVALSLLTPPANAQERAVLVAPAVPAPDDLRHPAVAPTGDGFAVVWAAGPRGALRFARYDTAGDPVVGPRDLLGHYPASIVVDHRLLAVAGGFVSYSVRGGNPTVVSVAIDGAGNQTAPSGVFFGFEGDEELFGFAAAKNRERILTARAEWYGGPTVKSQPSDAAGLPSGAAYTVTRGGIDPAGRVASVLDVPLAAAGNDFITVWADTLRGVRLRELGPNGQPRGDEVEIAPPAACPSWSGVAVVDGRQAVVYSAGCAQKDLFLRTRGHNAEPSAPVTLAGAPFDEGVPAFPGTRRPLRVVGGESRVAVLYSSLPFGALGPQRWILAEFDLDGGPLAPPRDLFAEFGLESVREVDLQRDAATGGYLLAWSGQGPSGPGVYVLALETAR